MGNRRMGLGRFEALLEAVDRDLNLVNSTLTNCTITTSAAVTLSGTNVLSGHTTTSSITKGLVVLTATDAITQAEHAGRTLLMAEVGGNADCVFTLPAATGTGNVYKFVVGVVNTSTNGYKIQVVGDDTIDGQVIVTNDTAAHVSNNSVISWLTVAASDTITLTGDTSGGASIGDYIVLTDIIADQWSVSGMLQASGTEVTPFSAAVS